MNYQNVLLFVYVAVVIVTVAVAMPVSSIDVDDIDVKTPGAAKPETRTVDSDFSLLFGTNQIPQELIPEPVKPKAKARRPNLGCQNFVCLLSKFDLMKTSTGYILTPQEDSQPVAKSGGGKECRRFDCWLAQFTSEEKSYGWELTFKPNKKNSHKDRSSSNGNGNSRSSSNFDDTARDESSAAKAPESELPVDAIKSLMLPASGSSKSNSQKSPILDYDSLFTKT